MSKLICSSKKCLLRVYKLSCDLGTEQETKLDKNSCFHSSGGENTHSKAMERTVMLKHCCPKKATKRESTVCTQNSIDANKRKWFI